jgi:hypothetical protein
MGRWSATERRPRPRPGSFRRNKELRSKFNLASRLHRSVAGFYDDDGNLLEPGIEHMLDREFTLWGELSLREGDEITEAS